MGLTRPNSRGTRSLFTRTAALTLALVLAACGGGDAGTGPDDDDDDGPGNNNGDTRVVLTEPSFAENIQEIFNRKGCTASSCHGAATSANLDLRPGVSYAELVNVAAFSEGEFLRVAPGDAQNSYIVMKVEGRQNVGATMPLTGSALDTTDRTNLRNWIDNGAPNN